MTETRLKFDFIVRGWASFGGEWKLVEIDVTKFAEFRDGGIHIDDWYAAISPEALLTTDCCRVLWTKDEERDLAMADIQFS